MRGGTPLLGHTLVGGNSIWVVENYNRGEILEFHPFFIKLCNVVKVKVVKEFDNIAQILSYNGAL